MHYAIKGAPDLGFVTSLGKKGKGRGGMGGCWRCHPVNPLRQSLENEATRDKRGIGVVSFEIMVNVSDIDW